MTEIELYRNDGIHCLGVTCCASGSRAVLTSSMQRVSRLTQRDRGWKMPGRQEHVQSFDVLQVVATLQNGIFCVPGMVISSGSSHKTDFLVQEKRLSFIIQVHDLMIVNDDFLIGREAFVPLVPFMGPLMVLDSFSLLSIWSQLMQSLIFT